MVHCEQVSFCPIWGSRHSILGLIFFQNPAISPLDLEYVLRQRGIRPNCKRAILAKHQQVMAPEGTNRGGMLCKAPPIKQHAPSYATHISCITAHVPTMGSLHRCTRKAHELHGSLQTVVPPISTQVPYPPHLPTSATLEHPAQASRTRCMKLEANICVLHT